MRGPYDRNALSPRPCRRLVVHLQPQPMNVQNIYMLYLFYMVTNTTLDALCP